MAIAPKHAQPKHATRFRTLVAATAGLLVIAASGLVTTPAEAAPTCNTSVRYGTVKVGSKGKSAKAVECLLKRGGRSASVNGKFSTADSRALKSFQHRVGLPRTGSVGKRTWPALLSSGARTPVRQGHRSAAVKRLQQSLTAAGTPVRGTGYFGTQTRTAVRKYQRSHRLTVTGTATGQTWRSLQAGGTKGPAKKTTSKKTSSKKTTSKKTTSKKAGTTGTKALAYAKKQLGDRYRYGGTGPSAWDCSGLTGGAWKAAGVKIPRTSQAQYRAGTKVSKSKLRPGDLVFFYSGRSHVAIYAGSGYVIHASRPGTPVQKIKMKYMPYNGAVRPD